MPRSLRYRGQQKPPMLCHPIPDSARQHCAPSADKIDYDSVRHIFRGELSEGDGARRKEGAVEITQLIFTLKRNYA